MPVRPLPRASPTPTPLSRMSRPVALRRTRAAFAPEWRTMFVTASRRTQENSFAFTPATASALWASGSSARIPAVCRARPAPSISPEKSGTRRRVTVERTSARDARDSCAIASISAPARAGSISSRRCASSALRVMTVREWPSTSCTSRAISSRSSESAREARAASARSPSSIR